MTRPSSAPSSSGDLPLSALWLALTGVTFFLTLGRQERFLAEEASSNLGLWLASLLFFLLYCRQLDAQEPRPAPALAWDRIDALILAGAVTLALLLRLPGLNGYPRAMHNDEGAMAVEALNVLNGSLQNPFAVGWYSHPALWFFLQAGVVRLLGESLAAVRLLPALLGSVTVAAVYGMARLLYTRRVAAAAALLLATYGFHIHFSRIALNNVADPLFGAAIVAALALALQNRSWLAWGAMGLLVGLALYFYMGARLFVLLVPLLWASWYAVHPQERRELRRPAGWMGPLLGFAGAVIAAGPLLLFFIQNPRSFVLRFNVAGLTAVSLAQQAGGERGAAVVLGEHLWRALMLFVWIPDDVSDFYDRTRPLLGGVAAVLLVIGIGVALSRIRRWPVHPPLLWSTLTLLFAGMLMSYPASSPRFVTLAPVACVFMALAIDWGLSTAEARWPAQRRLWRGATAGLLLYLALVSLHGYFVDYRGRETFGNVPSQAATALAQTLAAEPPGTQLWLLGGRWLSYGGFPIFRYLAPEVVGHDLKEPLVTPADVPAVEEGQHAVFAALPHRRDELRLVEARYPGGVWKAVQWPGRRHPLLVVYRR